MKESYQCAYAFETPSRSTITALHLGELPPEGSFISHSRAEFVISAVKEAKNGKGWIVRGYNISSEIIKLRFKSLRHFGNAARVILAEEEISPLKMDCDRNMEIPVEGHEVVSTMFSDLPARQF